MWHVLKFYKADHSAKPEQVDRKPFTPNLCAMIADHSGHINGAAIAQLLLSGDIVHINSLYYWRMERKGESPDAPRKPRAPQHVITRLEEIRRLASFENAKFGFDTEIVSVSSPFGEQREKTMSQDAFLKEGTRTYRESWLLPEIDNLLSWANGEEFDKG